MGNISRCFALFLAIVIVIPCLCFILAEPANAQTVPPSAPEFTVKQVDYSYDEPVTVSYSTDPFSGQQIADQSGGEHISGSTIVLTVKNQPFQPQNLTDGNVTALRFVIQWKGHFANWNDPPGVTGLTEYGNQSGSDYSTIEIPENDIRSRSISSGDQLDFRIRAQTGHYYTAYHEVDYHYIGAPSRIEQFTEFDVAQSSDWSSTQTLTIDGVQILETQLILVGFVISLIVIAVTVLLLKRKKRLQRPAILVKKP
jgi:hypothetical protein